MLCVAESVERNIVDSTPFDAAHHYISFKSLVSFNRVVHFGCLIVCSLL